MRMFRSFRTRIALLAVVLSSAVLAVFGVVAWQLAYRLGLDGVDEQLREECRRQNNEIRRPGHWERMERSLRGDAPEGADRLSVAVLLRARGRSEALNRTSNWPAEIRSETFSDPPEPPMPDPQPLNRPGPFGHLPAPGEPLPPGRERPGPGGFVPLQQGDLRGPPLPISIGRIATVATASGRWRICAGGSREHTVLVATNLRALEADLAQLRRVLMTAAVPGLLLIAAMGAFLASRALRPVAALTHTAERITARDLGQRIPTTRQAIEFQRLSEVFNAMLERLEKSFLQATRFSADAAHELKTPLTILQGRIEQSLGEAVDGSDHQRLCAELLEETQRLKGIVRKLLLLSLADAGQLKLQAESLDLSRMAADAADDARVLAPELRVETAIEDGVRVAGDEDLLGQVLQNLLGNAIKYNLPGGFLRVGLGRGAGRIRLDVANSGSLIAPEHRERIFERFFRSDPSHSRAVEGVGLGLSLAREIARAHGGDLVLERSDEAETCFVLTLPG